MVQKKNYVDRVAASEDYPHLNHALQCHCIFEDELKGVALVRAFFTRHDEKRGVNQSEVN